MLASHWKGGRAALGLWVAFPACTCLGEQKWCGLMKEGPSVRMGLPFVTLCSFLGGRPGVALMRTTAIAFYRLRSSGSPPSGQSTTWKVRGSRPSSWLSLQHWGEAQPHAASHAHTHARAHARTCTHLHAHAHTRVRTRAGHLLSLPVGLLLVPRCFLSTCSAS